MGGDRGPEAVIEGALAARADGIEPVIFGAAGLDTKGLELVETTQVVGMDEKPADVLRAKLGHGPVDVAVRGRAEDHRPAAALGDDPVRTQLLVEQL